MLKEGAQQFGSWLRAYTPNPFRKMVMKVEGLEDDTSWNGWSEHDHNEGGAKREGTQGANHGGLELTRMANRWQPLLDDVCLKAVDSDTFPKETPCLQSIVMVTPKITGSSQVEQNGVDMERKFKKADFQEQLKEIDSAVTIFNMVMQPVSPMQEVGLPCGPNSIELVKEGFSFTLSEPSRNLNPSP